ncbi:ribosomal protein S18-alanine N-acetyltransferase [Kangiella shandongensis]|uniref:ribosomal protein S18-alanine N-acetyltransferase n=1 Tax=Kangiella shandongensis TaxID=2763258 RepID=UPI001CBB2964|nr:ribosomal protein S18-alanine N-acetyltransferase [Kangiella shandongensis]
MSGIIIRPLEVVDLESITAIEQQAHDYPWKQSIHLSCIEQEYPSKVLELSGQVVAYAVYNYLYDECHLMNITTRPDCQGKGLATQLIHHMYQVARQQGMQSILLEVRESNLPAIQFYVKEGFQEIGQRPGYYPTQEGREGALVMRKDLTSLP